jgi:hypothetical protein
MISSKPPIRTLAGPLLLALAAVALAAAALGPSGALAQTRHACSGTHAEKSHGERACSKPSRKRAPRHASKPHDKRSHARKKGHGAPKTIFKAALCENGATPALGASGSFSCEDGSEPLCESGAMPTISRGGRSLVCAVSLPPAMAEENECEAEEPPAGEGQSCATTSAAGPEEPACEASGCEKEE